MFGICFHKWSKWQQYIESGTIQKMWQGIDIGDPYPYRELREKRACLKCGKLQDHVVRNLPA